MAATDMRLRLVIRRHGLPEVKLVWPCAASDDLTVASLLSQVNEVVTLESGQWGLEDYAVELADQSGGSFECLHFQQVGKLLKHDDQVIIRSLLTEDLRQRRISGRHQISGDGIHLVDGIPFGRRRGPRDRPVLTLPPRKRARITYNDSSQDDEQEIREDSPDARRLLLEDTPRLDQDDEEDEDDSEDDVDYSPDDDSDTDEEGDHAEALAAEIRFAREDNGTFEDDAGAADEQESKGRRVQNENETKGQESSSQLLKLEGMTPAAVLALQAAFPLTPHATIEEKLDGRNSNLEATYKDLASSNDPALNYDAMMSIFMEHRFNHVMAPEPVLLPETPKAGKPLIEEIEEPQAVAPSAAEGPLVDATDGVADIGESSSDSEDSSNSDDSENVAPAASSHQSSSDEESSSEDSGSDGSSEDENDREESLSEARKSSPLLRQAFPNTAFGISSDSDSGSDSESESDSQTSGSSSDNSDEGPHDSSSQQGNQMSSDDSSSDSSEDSDAPPDEQSATYASTGRSKPTPKTQATLPESTTSIAAEVAPQPPVGRAQGLNRTQKRNARRRLAKQKHRQEEAAAALDQSEAQDVVMEEMSLSERRRELAKAVQDAEAASSDESSSLASSSSSGSSSDSEVSPDQDSTAGKEKRPRIEVVESEDAQEPQEPSAATPNPPKNLETTLLPVDSSGLPITTPNTSAVKDDGVRKRMKVDMGAGRRLLFGALGLKNPKSKADEEKLKKDLMKDVKPHQNHRQETGEEGQAEPEPELEPEGADDDDWRNKITYRAVECCYEGMVLSEPPFPFVQRWDPQQQYNSMRKRKRDSQHFEEYYEEDSWAQPQANGSSKKKKKKKNQKRASEKQQDVAENNDNYIELDYDDPPAKEEAGDTQATDLDDLPSLPADPSTLPSISWVDAKVGMVISWQRLELSKATNWQPQMQWVTGVIVSKEADKIHLVLAKRDREKDERVFDEDGNRMYDKFEMPEDNEMDEEYKPDDGRREMPWSELTETRLLQGEPTPSMLNSPVEGSFEDVDVQSFDDNAETSQALASSINDVDSVQLRAGVEEELKNLANEVEEDPESSFIPHGQTHGFLDFAAETVGQSASGNNSEEPSQPSTSDKTARDDSHSQNKTSDVIVKDSQVTGQPPRGNGESQADSLGERYAGTDVDVKIGDGQKDQTPSVDYPQLPVPSSASSLGSGRRPESDIAESPNNNDEGTPVPESAPSALPDSALYTQEKDSSPGNAHSRESSSDSFPSLDEIFHTAKTSKMQSPLKSSQGSALAQKNKKLKQEPLASSQRPNIADVPESNGSLFPNATQPEPELPSISTPRRSPRHSQGKSSPFKIPAGNQVITLSSSPTSERYTEKYAEDDVDDTYEDPDSSSLPKGAGWVAKKKKNPARRGRPRKMSA